MSFIFAAKKPSEFNEHPQHYGAMTLSGYTCYQLYSDKNYDSPLFSENEIWFNVWGSANQGNISYHNYYILSASTNVSVRRINSSNAGVYVNGADTGERIAFRSGLNPWLFHVKSGVSDGIFEVYYDGNQVYALEDANILNGAPITMVRLIGGSGQSINMVMRDAIVATHEIPCGLLLEEVAADISALNGWTQSGTELSTETAGATFTMKPNAAAIATLSTTKAIDGILPSFVGAASANVSSIDVNSDDTIQLSTTSTDYVGKVRTLAQANAGLTVEAVA